MGRIVRKAGGDIDTSRDYEYTDWKDVADFGRELAAAASPVAAPAAPAR